MTNKTKRPLVTDCATHLTDVTFIVLLEVLTSSILGSM